MDDLGSQHREKHPFDKANVLSKITFGYLFNFFKKGYQKDLEEEDIYKVTNTCKSKTCGDGAEKQWYKTPTLLKTLCLQFGMKYLLLCALTIAWTEVTTILSPLGQSKVIAYFTPNQKKISEHQVYGYAGVLVFLSLTNFVVMNNIHTWEEILGVEVQAALKSLLYRKALRLSPATAGASLGNIVTLITKDVYVLEQNLWMMREFALFLIEFFTIAYLLYQKMGNPAFIGLGFIFAGLPIQIYLSAKLKSIRLSVGKNSDERIQRMQETLSAIKIIKMYTWERFFYDRISESRRKEINTLVKVFLIHAFIEAIGFIISKISFIIQIMTYIWMGYETSTELIFYIMQLYTKLSTSFGSTLPQNFLKSVQFYASVIRLDEILKTEEIERFDSEYVEKPSVVLKKVCFDMRNKAILKDISMDITFSGLYIVTGSVGCGKTSLLKVVLRDYQPLRNGTVDICGNISYASQDPWIFPATVRQNILFGEEYNKTRYDEVIRVCGLEYDISLLENGDQTVLSDSGHNISKGQQARINLARAVYRNTNIYLLDDVLTALDTHVQDLVFRECIQKFLKDKIVILVSQKSSHIARANQVFFLNEGKMIVGNNIEEFSDDHFKSTEFVKNRKSSKVANIAIRASSKIEKKLSQVEREPRRKSIYREAKKEGGIDFNIYKKYFQFGGGFLVFLLIVLIYVVAQFCDSYSDELLTNWVDDQENVVSLERKHKTNGTTYEKAVYQRNFTLALAGILILSRSVLSVAKSFSILWFCRTASINLHKKMALAIIGATMAFYDTHFIGNVLNRLSYDLNNVDEVVPSLLPGFGNNISHAIGSLALIASVSWIFLIPVLVFLGALILLRNLYMPAARSLKRLEAATRSPLVGHINSSLEGLTTVRAFKAEENLKEEFDRYQDLYSSALVTTRMASNALNFYLDFMSALLTIVVIGRFLFFGHSSSAGNVGLALTQVFKLTQYVESTVKQLAKVETSMTSVERAVEYTTLVQESKNGTEVENWPSKGAIRFEKVTLTYEGCKTPILRGIHFDIKPKERVGIVGRSGAGKSSIITVLYRLYEFEGLVDIDGVSTKSLSLEFLRKSISIIPQDPVLFTGTMRENIDPQNKYSDETIWSVIRRVGIQDMVPSLDIIIEDSGSHYSSGQKQLVCLARAAISKSKVLVLDEATANMDAETDKMLHDIIFEVFSDCTVLMIAHRMHLILNCDKVLVLDKGNIAEFDDPRKLVTQEGSLFSKMCQESKME